MCKLWLKQSRASSLTAVYVVTANCLLSAFSAVGEFTWRRLLGHLFWNVGTGHNLLSQQFMHLTTARAKAEWPIIKNLSLANTSILYCCPPKTLGSQLRSLLTEMLLPLIFSIYLVFCSPHSTPRNHLLFLYQVNCGWIFSKILVYGWSALCSQLSVIQKEVTIRKPMKSNF